VATFVELPSKNFHTTSIWKEFIGVRWLSHIYFLTVHLNFEMLVQMKYLLCIPKFDGGKHGSINVRVAIGLDIAVSLD